MYPSGMRMPMPMPTPPQMSPQSFFPPGGFPAQPRIPGGFPMANGIGSFGGQMPVPPVQEPSKIGSFLQQANSLFNTAKTYTPYIQQAMPMVKNIPSLLKLYKGFQGLPAAGAGAVAAEAQAVNEEPLVKADDHLGKVHPIRLRNHCHLRHEFSNHLCK